MGDEILEVEIELGDNSKHKMKVKHFETFEMSEIEKGKKAILTLVNGEQMLIIVNNADLEGVSFNIIGTKQTYFFEERVIEYLLVEI